jgi:hypothetical protein
MHGFCSVMTATAVDPRLSCMTVKLQPYRRGDIGRAGEGEPKKPHLVFAKSRERNTFRAANVYRGVKKVFEGAGKPLFDKITISLHNLSLADAPEFGKDRQR